MTATLTTNQRLQVVKHLAAGQDLDFTATATRLGRDVVLDIGSHHGYPHLDKLKRAAELLEDKADRETDAANLTEGSAIPATRNPINTQSAPRPAPVQPEKPDEFRILINTAKSHPSKRIQAAANRVLDDVARLRSLLDEDQAKHAERRRVEAAKAAARAEVERLEAQLKAAKAKLRGTVAAPAAPDEPTVTVAEGSHACDEDGCDRTFTTVQALRMHERRAHEGFDPHAAAKAAS